LERRLPTLPTGRQAAGRQQKLNKVAQADSKKINRNQRTYQYVKEASKLCELLF